MLNYEGRHLSAKSSRKHNCAGSNLTPSEARFALLTSSVLEITQTWTMVRFAGMRLAGHAKSSTFRTLRPRVSAVNGLGMKCIPGIALPFHGGRTVGVAGHEE